MVLNIDQTIKAIEQALQNCHASNPNLEINEVYVGIAGHHIKSLQTRGDMVRQDPENEIQSSEIDTLIENLQKYSEALKNGDADRMKALIAEGRELKEENLRHRVGQPN